MEEVEGRRGGRSAETGCEWGEEAVAHCSSGVRTVVPSGCLTTGSALGVDSDSIPSSVEDAVGLTLVCGNIYHYYMITDGSLNDGHLHQLTFKLSTLSSNDLKVGVFL